MEAGTALSLWQPWATFMVQRIPGGDAAPKVNETRSWQRGHKGRLIIHAAKYKGPEVGDIFGAPGVQTLLDVMGYARDGRDLPRGCLIGEVDIKGYKKTENLAYEVTGMEFMLGNYEAGRWAWMTTPGSDVAYPLPIPFRGHQQLFPVPADADIAREELPKPPPTNPQGSLF